MRAPHMLTSILAVALLTGAAARDPDQSQGRFQLRAAEGGSFLRLDTQTGAVSVCQRKESKWVCEPLADERRALEAEIDRLAGENRELSGAVKRLEELLGLPDPDGKDKRSKRGSFKFQLPSERDVDQAMDYIGRLLRKFRDKMREFDDRSL